MGILWKPSVAVRALCCGSMLLASTPALAYLDPGTGSMILQGIIAGIAAVSFTLKIYWYRIKGFFTRSGSNPDEDEKPEAGDPEPYSRK